MVLNSHGKSDDQSFGKQPYTHTVLVPTPFFRPGLSYFIVSIIFPVFIILFILFMVIYLKVGSTRDLSKNPITPFNTTLDGFRISVTCGEGLFTFIK